MIRAAGTRLAVALTVRIGRRRNSATSATITGAAAAPISVPGPQTRATVNDAAADATLAMISVCGEMPLGRRWSPPPVWGSEDSSMSTYPASDNIDSAPAEFVIARTAEVSTPKPAECWSRRSSAPPRGEGEAKICPIGSERKTGELSHADQAPTPGCDHASVPGSGRCLPSNLLDDLAEDREAPLLGEPVHGVLDSGLHLEVDRVDVGAVLEPLRVVVDMDRVEYFGADLCR